MEKQLGWAPKLGEVEPLWILKMGLTVLARLMGSKIWHQPTDSVGEQAQQRDNVLCSPQCQTIQYLPVYHWCPSSCHPSAGAQREWVWLGEPMCVPQEELLRAPEVSTSDNCCWISQPEIGGIIFLAQKSWAGGSSVGQELLAPETSLLNFYPLGCGAACSASVPLPEVWTSVVSTIP